MLMGTGLAHATQRRRFFEKKKDLRADRLRRESALTVMNDEGIEEMEEENEMRRWRRPPTRGEWAQEAAEEEAARVAAAQAAAAAAVADEREVQRLSQLPRAVMAFRKPAAIEGWKQGRAGDGGGDGAGAAVDGSGNLRHGSTPSGRRERTGRRTKPFHARSTLFCTRSTRVPRSFCVHVLRL